MPTSPLLTQILHVPDNWLVESVASPYDLDNIRLEDVEMGVYRYDILNITILYYTKVLIFI
jgi:UDP-glucose:glycoprotein glucosyltransferase